MTTARTPQDQVSPADPVTTIELITPELAYKILDESNTHNRPLKQSRVNALIATLERNEWVLTHQGIAFDRSGILQDGQHRLWAIAMSGISARMMVTRNADPEAFDVIDIGGKRTGGDIMSIEGEEYGNTLSAALSWKVRYDMGIVMNQHFRPSFPQLREALDRSPGIREFLTVASLFSPKTILPGALATWFAYEISQLDHEAAHDFLVKLGSGTDLPQYHACLTLRNRLMAIRMNREKLPGVYLAVYCAKGWNAFAAGQQIRKLSFSDRETFPGFAKPLARQDHVAVAIDR